MIPICLWDSKTFVVVLKIGYVNVNSSGNCTPSLILCTQLDFFHVEEMADHFSISEPLFEATLYDDLVEGVQVNI